MQTGQFSPGGSVVVLPNDSDPRVHRAADAHAAPPVRSPVGRRLLGRPRSFFMDHAYWGREYGDAEIEESLQASGTAPRRLDDDGLLDCAVEDLVSGKVIGWFQGRFEWGPRVLGNRSILADPRQGQMKDRVNTCVKFREPFRPFASSIMAESASDYFSTPALASQPTARFMLSTSSIRPDRRERLPAVVHVDGSSLPQIVDPCTNRKYHHLINIFHDATGVPALLNTSFNLRGETIVTSPADAISTFWRSGMDALYLVSYVVSRSERRKGAIS